MVNTGLSAFRYFLYCSIRRAVDDSPLSRLGMSPPLALPHGVFAFPPNHVSSNPMPSMTSAYRASSSIRYGAFWAMISASRVHLPCRLADRADEVHHRGRGVDLLPLCLGGDGFVAVAVDPVEIQAVESRRHHLPHLALRPRGEDLLPPLVPVGDGEVVVPAVGVAA